MNVFVVHSLLRVLLELACYPFLIFFTLNYSLFWFILRIIKLLVSFIFFLFSLLTIPMSLNLLFTFFLPPIVIIRVIKPDFKFSLTYFFLLFQQPTFFFLKPVREFLLPYHLFKTISFFLDSIYVEISTCSFIMLPLFLFLLCLEIPKTFLENPVRRTKQEFIPLLFINLDLVVTYIKIFYFFFF